MHTKKREATLKRWEYKGQARTKGPIEEPLGAPTFRAPRSEASPPLGTSQNIMIYISDDAAAGDSRFSGPYKYFGLQINSCEFPSFT